LFDYGPGFSGGGKGLAFEEALDYAVDLVGREWGNGAMAVVVCLGLERAGWGIGDDYLWLRGLFEG
jgi:hypothetical protein